MWTGERKDRTTNLLVSGQPSLPPEPQAYFVVCERRNTAALTLDSDVEGTAGPAVLILGQAAVLPVSPRRDLHDLQHRQFVGGDGAHQLAVFEPGEGRGRAALGAAVQGQRGALLDRHGVVHQGLARRVCMKK